MGKLFSTTEAAKFLNVSVRTLKYWVKAGKLVPKVCKLGRGKGAKFALEDLKSVQSSKFKHYTKRVRRRHFKKLEGVVMRKLQVQLRTRKKIVPRDKLSRHMFNYPPAEYAEILKFHDQCDCYENEEGTIITPYWLELVEGYVDLSPLNAFHREVLFHAISAYEQGIRVITLSTTLDSLTGGVEKRHVYKEQYKAIRAAFDKLAFTRIEIDLAPLFKAYPNYQRNYSGELKLIGTLLPCRFLEGEINGQKTFAIELLAESPLMTVAKAKKQLITYDASPLAIAGQNNTPQVITLKNYLLRRIKQIARGLNSSILFETLYENCGLADASDSVKQNARKEIVDILKSFKAAGVIQNFEFERAGRAYRSIKIMTNSPRRLRQNRA